MRRSIQRPPCHCLISIFRAIKLRIMNFTKSSLLNRMIDMASIVELEKRLLDFRTFGIWFLVKSIFIALRLRHRRLRERTSQATE